MSVYFALMAILGQLVLAYGLSYPVAWVIERTIIPITKVLLRLHRKWDGSYRD